MTDVPPYRPDDFADPSAQQRPPSYGQPQFQQTPYGQQMAPQQGPYQQPYGAPRPYGYGPVEHPQAQMVFILGIVGIFTGVVSFVAWYMGGQAKKEIEAGAPFPFEGNLKTGYTLGKVFSIIYIVLFGLGIVFWILYVILMLGMFATLR